MKKLSSLLIVFAFLFSINYAFSQDEQFRQEVTPKDEVRTPRPLNSFQQDIKTPLANPFDYGKPLVNMNSTMSPDAEIFYEGFESGNTQDIAPVGWTQASVSGSASWLANTSLVNYNRTPRTGSWNAYLKYSNTDWMFRSVDLTGGQEYTLSFYARQDVTSGTNILASYGTEATIVGMTNSIISSTAVTNGDYQLFSGVFTPAVTGTYYIGIRADLTSSPWYISIDDISLISNTGMTFVSSTTEQATTSPVIQGSINNEVVRLKVVTDGVLNPFNVTSITFNTTGTTSTSDLTNARVYYTTSTTFSTATQFGSAVPNPNGSFSVTGTQALSNGANYFWLAYDISGTATPYNVVDAQCTQFVSTEAKANHTPDVTDPGGSRTIRAPLSGTYTIDQGGSGITNYTTFTAAIDELNLLGISGPVTFNVAAGQTWDKTVPASPYNYAYIIFTTGTEANPIIFQKSGEGANPKLNILGTSATSDMGVWIYGDYTTFNGIDIYDAGTTSTDYLDRGIYIQGPTDDGCKYNTIKNSTIDLSKANVNSRGIYLYTNAPTSVANANNFNKFYNNTIQDTYYGYYFSGNSTYLNDGNEIGIDGGTSLIDNIGGSNVTVYGVYAPYETNFKMFNTTISNVTASTTIYCFYDGLGATSTHQIYNNTFTNVTGTSTSSGVYGIYNTSDGTCNIYNNVFKTFTAAYLVAPIYITTVTTTNIYNNKIYDIAYSETSTQIAYGMYISGGTNHYIYNNFIYDIKAPSATSSTTNANVRGLSLTGGTNAYVYYNTVFLDYISSGATNQSAALYVGSSPTLDLRNNIFVNNVDVTTGTRAVAFYKTTTSLTNFATTSNNNLYYTGTPSAKNLIFYDGTNPEQTLAGYKSRMSTRDQNAASENPPFVSAVSPYDLKLKTDVATQVESGGQRVTTPIAVTTDFENNIRWGEPTYAGTGTAPDIGADEFDGIPQDLTPPNIAYTAFTNTSSLTDRTLTATITDASGVPTSGIGLPVLYWKINSGTYSSAQGVSIGSNQYTFTFGSGVVVTDTVSYYVVAQDNVPNVGAYPAGGAAGFTANPPAASTPPTIPSSYLIVATPLSGDYTVGTSMFNKITGKNIYFEKVVTKVMEQIPVYEEGTKENGGEARITGTKMTEVEQISWVPMENGKKYDGELYAKKSVNPNLNYLSGTDGVYATITAAVTDLNLRGVSGPVRFLLTDATYTTGESYPITIDIASSDLPTATNTVTFKPNTGVTASISGAPTASSIFKFNGADYIIIDGSNTVGGSTKDLTIENTATAGGVIWLTSKGIGAGATYNTVKNTNIVGYSNASGNYAIFIGGTSLGSAGDDNDYNTIQNNIIGKAYYGIYALAGVTGKVNDLNIIQNIIGNSTDASSIGNIGVYLTQVANSNIVQNEIFNLKIGTTPKGISLTTGCSGLSIDRNKIYTIKYNSTGGYGGWGIHVAPAIASSNILVTNNMIFDIQGDGYSSITNSSMCGIMIDGVSDLIKVYYNSVNLFGDYSRSSATITAAVYVGSSITNLDLRDNVLVNSMVNTTTSTSKSYTVYSVAANTAYSNINYNDYYSSGTQGVLGYITGADVIDLAAWKTATGQDANSVTGDPIFTSNTDLHIIPTELSPVHNAGTPIAGITTDFDGNARDGSTPDIGADEYTYTPPSIENPTDFAATPFSGSQINLGWTPNGSSNPVMVAVNTTDAFGDPVAGQPYEIGDPLGTATIIYKGPDGSYSHSGLNSSTTYYYKAFSYNEPFDPSELIYSPGVTANATTLCGVTTAPFVQDFELATFPPICWAIDGLSSTWARSTSASGYGVGTASTFVNFYGISSGSREMTTFEFNRGALTTPLLKFDHAYATYSGENDQLRIDYSTNAGTDWTQLVLYDGGTSGPLNTGGTTTDEFVPTAGQWATKSVIIPEGTNKLKFVGISAYGNNLYLDNIKVEEAPTFPIFSISPESMAYGDIAIGGGSVDQTFTITNTGGQTLTINSSDFTLTGTDPTQFQILGASTLNLTNGQSGTVRVQFIPNTSIGDKTANLHIVDNIAKSVHDIPLTGTSVVNPAQSLLGGITAEYKPSLSWQAPQPGSEIKIDDGTVEGNYWLSSPSSTNHYFTNKLTAPHAGDLTQIAFTAYAGSAGNMFNSVVVCPDDGTGKPNLAAPYATFSNVGVGTSSAWVFCTLTTPIAVTAGQTFYIAVQWPEGSTTGPYVGTDMTVLHNRSFYSVDAGANWTDAPGNFFMRAYMNTSGDNLISGNPSPDMKLIPIKTLTDVKKESGVKNTNKKEIQHSVPAALIYGRNGEKVLSSYTVRRGTETGVYTQDFTGINALTYDDISAVLGTRYYYVVDAVYTEGTSAHSNEVSVLPQNPNYGTFSNGLGGFYKFSNSTASGSPESKPNYEWLPTTDFTPITFADNDDGNTEVQFGGSKKFKFFGTDYTSVFVGVNGYLTFGAGATDYTPAGALPQVGDPANMIAFAFRDMYNRTTYTPASSVSYKIFTDKIVISYNNLYDRTGADGTNYISVQIALYISDAPTLNSLCIINYNDELSYAPLATNTVVTLASLGVNGPGGTVGFNYRYLGIGGPMFDGVALSPSGANAMALAFGDQDIPLPVSLASFTSSVNGRDVRLSWKTESETNNAGFEIERSEADMNQWVKAGYVSGKGTISTPTTYTFEDKKLTSGKFNYRLKQIDNNGNFEYHALSNVVEIGLPTKFELSQNYPNPFNPVTKIDFSLPLDAKVSIKLYDITGREIKTLVNDQRTAGYYTVQFNGSDISSGTYFYRIMTKSSGADYIMTKKMVLVK